MKYAFIFSTLRATKHKNISAIDFETFGSCQHSLRIVLRTCQKMVTYNLLLTFNQEKVKVRVVIPHIGPIPILIPLKLFLDIPRDPVAQEG